MSTQNMHLNIVEMVIRGLAKEIDPAEILCGVYNAFSHGTIFGDHGGISNERLEGVFKGLDQAIKHARRANKPFKNH